MKLMSLFKTNFHPALLLALALLAIPRVVLHDLQLVSFDSPIYRMLAVGPFLVWAGVAVVRRTNRPIKDYLVLGAVFGILLAITHQILWTASLGDNPPRLGGSLAGVLNPTIEMLLLRGAAGISSIATGLFAGVILGLIGLVARLIRSKIA